MLCGYRDIRKLGEPLESMPLQQGTDGALLGGVTLNYDLAAGPTNFLVGTEQGTVLLCKVRRCRRPPVHSLVHELLQAS
jgi:dynein intermediate chain 2, axonemal